MRRTIFAVMMVGFIFLSYKCFAQTAPQQAQSNSPQQEEKTIFSFKNEIGLSDEQENKIKALLFDSENSMKTYNRDLNPLLVELGAMIKKEEDLNLIKSKLTEISKIQIEIECYRIENARKIRGVLSADQIKKWEDIKKAHARK